MALTVGRAVKCSCSCFASTATATITITTTTTTTFHLPLASTAFLATTIAFTTPGPDPSLATVLLPLFACACVHAPAPYAFVGASRVPACRALSVRVVCAFLCHLQFSLAPFSRHCLSPVLVPVCPRAGRGTSFDLSSSTSAGSLGFHCSCYSIVPLDKKLHRLGASCSTVKITV